MKVEKAFWYDDRLYVVGSKEYSVFFSSALITPRFVVFVVVERSVNYQHEAHLGD